MAGPAPTSTYLTQGTSPASRSGENVKPTILTFHGSGSNATIHTVQLARLTRLLKPHFHVENLEAPFPSAAGPGILPFFEGCGPFKRWIPPSEKLSIDGMKRGEASGTMPLEVEAMVRNAVSAARSKGSKVIGLIGFSQGTRVVAGLLKGAEIVRAVGPGNGGAEWLQDIEFALSMCGSYPPPLVPSSASSLLHSSSLSESEQAALLDAKIKLPTLHVQGKQDEWAWAGKLLIEGSYEGGEGMSEVLECDMGHHYPQKQDETDRVGEWVLSVLRIAEVEKQ